MPVCCTYICAHLVHAHVRHVPCDYFGLSYSSFLAHHHPWWESGMLALSLSHCNKIWGREVKESAKARGGTGPERPAWTVIDNRTTYNPFTSERTEIEPLLTTSCTEQRRFPEHSLDALCSRTLSPRACVASSPSRKTGQRLTSSTWSTEAIPRKPTPQNRSGIACTHCGEATLRLNKILPRTDIP